MPPKASSFLISFPFFLYLLVLHNLIYPHGFHNHQHNMLRSTQAYLSSDQTSLQAQLTDFQPASEHIYLQIPHIKPVQNWDFIFSPHQFYLGKASSFSSQKSEIHTRHFITLPPPYLTIINKVILFPDCISSCRRLHCLHSSNNLPADSFTSSFFQSP